jgi:tryptophan synthase alpha chain
MNPKETKVERTESGMNDRIRATFEKLKKQGRKAFVGYLTAGDPNMAESEENMRAVLECGVDILEIGVPFSDPTADGPAIQEASQRSLAAGTTFRDVIGLVERIRADFDTPLIVFGYANPLFSYGYEAACRDLAVAGADGLLVVDIPFEEESELLPHSEQHDLALIRLVAPTTDPARLAAIMATARGFVYYIMVTGVTGRRSSLRADVAGHVQLIRKHTSLPVVVGFGVSNGKQACEAASLADGVVVGSALVQAARNGNLAALARELSVALGGE